MNGSKSVTLHYTRHTRQQHVNSDLGHATLSQYLMFKYLGQIYVLPPTLTYPHMLALSNRRRNVHCRVPQCHSLYYHWGMPKSDIFQFNTYSTGFNQKQVGLSESTY